MTNSNTHKSLTKVWPQQLNKQRSAEGDIVELALWVPDDLDYFQGHFPNAPILAGVVQLHWAVEFAKQEFSLSEQTVQNLEVLKFKAVITPGQNLQLTLTQKTTSKIIFSYSSDKGQHASGRIVFESTC